LQQFDVGEADAAEQVELIRDRSWRIFSVDVFEDSLAILGTAESFEVVAVPRPHQFLDRHGFLNHQIGDPKRSAGTQHRDDLFKRGSPIFVVAQVMQHRGGQHDVVAFFWQISFAEVSVPSGDLVDAGVADPVLGPLEHRGAQVEQVAGERLAVNLPKLQRVVASSTTDVQHPLDLRRQSHGRFGDQLHRQRRVNRRRLAGFQVTESLDIGIETRGDIVGGRLR
jgi:hypothetical protein